MVCIFMPGQLIIKKLNLFNNNRFIIEKIAISFGAGFSLLIIILTILGFIGLLNPTILWIMLLLFLFSGIINSEKQIIKKEILKASFYKLTKSDLVILLLISICLILYLITALSPTLDGDSLSSYLLLPREYAKNNSIVRVDYAIGNMYPQNGQLISTFGLLIKGQILAQLLISWTMGLICIITIYSIGKFLFNKQAALIGILIWYGTYTVAFLSQSAKIDFCWAAFDLLAIYTFIRWYYSLSKDDEKWLIISGLFLGIASGVKQATFFTIILLFIAMSLRIFEKKGFKDLSFLKSYFKFFAPISISLVWIIRCYLLTGSFFYTGSDLYVDRGIFGFFKTIWGMSMLGNAESLEGPMGKSIGPTIIALLPLIFFIKNNNKRIWHILGYSILMLILWNNGVQRARHLLPTLGLLSIVSGYIINWLLLEKRKTGYTFLLLIILSIGLNLSPWAYVNFISVDRMRYLVGKQDINSYLQSNLSKWEWYPNFDITTKINNDLPLNAKIVALSSGNSYYIDRPFYAPGPALLVEPWTDGFKEYPEHIEYYKILINSNISHVFINSFVVKQRKLENSWINQSEFKERYLDVMLKVGGQSLYKIKLIKNIKEK